MKTLKADKSIAVRQQQVRQGQALEKKLRAAAQMYEKQFLREMVKAMRSTVTPGKLTEPSMAEKIYRDKLDDQYVEAWGDRGGIGLGDMIYRQIKERFYTKQPMRPQGPLEVEPQKVFPVKNPNEKPRDFKPLNETSFLLQPPSNEAVGHSFAVVSPWAGRVLESRYQEELGQLIKVQHDNGLQSLLNFKGQREPTELGELVPAGKPLGSLEQGLLAWKVTKIDPA